MYSYEELQTVKTFTPTQIREAALIMHPGMKGYNITADEIAHLFEEGSNYEPLKTPITDAFGNEFWDNEGYYMAARTQNPEIKKAIAFRSAGFWLSRKARKMYDLELDELARIDYMREGIRKKFDANPHLKERLDATWDREIIEYTFWKDIFFGIDQENLTGKSILGMLLMEYRDAHKNDWTTQDS